VSERPRTKYDRSVTGPRSLRFLGGGAAFAWQMARAVRFSGLPTHPNQDPTGTFGDPASPPVRIVLMGDSSVTAPGVVPIDDSWPRRMAMRVADRWRVELVSVAVGGARAADVLANQVPPALATRADIAMVSVGANDAFRGTPIRLFEDRYDRIITELEQGIPHIGVSGVGDLGILTRLPTLARSIARVRGLAVDGAIRRVVWRHPGVVKSTAWGPQWAPLYEGDPDVVLATDRFHASAEGHAVFADAAAPVLDELLARVAEARGLSSWRSSRQAGSG
jgi:lysophospholipase L1-like esterase